MMNTNANAILLLTSHFSRSGGGADDKPLTPAEWGRFAFWLHQQRQTPARLLDADAMLLLAGWHDKTITLERIVSLLGRGHALALALEKWTRVGIWVLTRSDAEYPRLLKQRLRGNAPAVLYGCGNKALLNAASVAVVGSRNAGEDDLADSHMLGQRIALSGHAIVSGGARGVDEAAMLGGLEHGGTAIGVLADSLFAAATSRKWRKALMSGDLVLVSPYYPEASFNAGNAMGRNKHIYCLSSAAIVVHSGDKGGTWSGAEENLKKAWTPLWTKPTKDKAAANGRLVEMGASWVPMPVSELNVMALRSAMQDNARSTQKESVFRVADDANLVGHEVLETCDVVAAVASDAAVIRDNGAPTDESLFRSNFEQRDAMLAEESSNEQDVLVETTQVGLATGFQKPAGSELSFYDLFLMKLGSFPHGVTASELSEEWHVPRKLVDEWLARAVDDGVMVPSGKKPVKYHFNGAVLIN
ncbi:DNA-processing protein DprA [Xanthomonas campestris]|uniref:DNA-processing protein DprA n=2 Tax=Xanthomonas campestris TaxID=339 RepID=UPI00236567DA|nr:DNA-processing protein DprA [Xanthomonas campestris]MEA9784063.1 DNA-processing protein DprA [Xanthomonas campestris pv. raphani]MEA9804373.1 DNA-processing protein DprA [Xanthomonas campestris pv. raphani]MEA9821021.1 DNA-processing protein DprA [Xanthomonas campestris pv. raphani]MEA9873613.1 DNA-processing protein DprA [Xanthomonas campestris pv. raphani]MEA9881240.1 DNA-processing protein DprA [Xanthomonas campestris pv. raphani]